MAGPTTTLFDRSTFPRRAHGGGSREDCAGNTNPSVRETEKAAGASKKRKNPAHIHKGEQLWLVPAAPLRPNPHKNEPNTE